jgi:hypothetical protein
LEVYIIIPLTFESFPSWAREDDVVRLVVGEGVGGQLFRFVLDPSHHFFPLNCSKGENDTLENDHTYLWVALLVGSWVVRKTCFGLKDRTLSFTLSLSFSCIFTS